MSDVRGWSSMIVLVVLTAGILQYPMPTGNMEKVTRLVIRMFIIYGILLPVGRLVQQFDVQTFAQEEDTTTPNRQYQDTVNQQTVEAAQTTVHAVVIATLSEKGIRCKSVALGMNTNEGGHILITKVFVSLGQGEPEKPQEAKKLLEQGLRLTTEVTADGGP